MYRLITLDKGEGLITPIGVGEVFRRIMAKCLIQITKPDILDVTGSLQVSAGQKSGNEAAVHAMNSIFSSDEADAALLIDAIDAFNTLNRAAALHNISILCPTIATFVIAVVKQQFVLGINPSIFLCRNSFGANQRLALTRKSFRIAQVSLQLSRSSSWQIFCCNGFDTLHVVCTY